MPLSLRLKYFLKISLSLFLPLLGIGLIALGVFADRFGFGKSHGSGMGPLEKLCLLAGIASILIWAIFRKQSDVIGSNLLTFLVLTLIADPILYSLSPWLAPTLVGRMSSAAQQRYAHFHQGQERYVFYNRRADGNPDDYCYDDMKGRPYYAGFEFTYVYQYDELGYRNPPGYISKNDADVLLLGDSFIEGLESAVTAADYLRKYVKPLAVYSTGVCGAGPQHYLCQYRHYIQLKNPHRKPRYVFVNIYGNDFVPKSPGNVRKPRKAQAMGKKEEIDFDKRKPATDQTKKGNGLPEYTHNDEKRFFLNPPENNSRLPFKNEVFIIFEHSLEETLVKILMYPKKYAVFNQLLHSVGINQSQWQRGMQYYRTLDFDTIDWDILTYQLSNIDEEITETNPHTNVFVSLIPNASEACDIRVREEDEPRCAKAFINQQRISRKLNEICEGLRLHYIDVTPKLREDAAHSKESLYMWNGHFNLYGNDLYAQFLAQQISN